MGYTVNIKLCSLVEEREREREAILYYRQYLSMRLCLL